MAVAAPRRAPPRRVPPRPRAPAGPAVPRGPAPLPLQFAGALLTLPLNLLTAGLRLAFRTVGFGVAVASAVARRVLPRPVADRLAGAARAITAGPAQESPAAAAEAFAAAFGASYGARHPRWQACGWQEAAARAQAEGKFLFVYLHSPLHQDADAFCAGTLAAPAFVDYVNSTFLAWGGDLRGADAFRLSTALRAAAYPYTALLAFSGARCGRRAGGASVCPYHARSPFASTGPGLHAPDAGTCDVFVLGTACAGRG
jgi:FAS-associated factor 2